MFKTPIAGGLISLQQVDVYKDVLVWVDSHGFGFGLGLG
jgi:hypothetical protein